MAENGYLSVRVYSTAAQLPIEGALVTVTQPSTNGTRLLASRITDRSGNIERITIEAPDRSETLHSGIASPFTLVDISVDAPGYERILVENAQIFAGIISQQNMDMIPIEELPKAWNTTEVFQVSAQAL